MYLKEKTRIYLGLKLGMETLIVNLCMNTLISLIFWVFWTVLSTGSTYFYFIPKVYQDIPLWNFIGIFGSFGMLLIFTKTATTIITIRMANPETNEGE